MFRTLTPQEALQAIADGKKLKYKWYSDDEWYMFDPLINGVYLEHVMKGRIVFRLAQERITIGDVSFPKPVSKPLEYGTEYWFVDLLNTDLCLSDAWDNMKEDHHRLQIGSIHLTEENAIAHAKALIKLSVGNVDE